MDAESKSINPADKISDNYITPPAVWEMIDHIIPKDKIVWDPFYCDGSSGNDLLNLGCKQVIHRPYPSGISSPTSLRSGTSA